MKTTYKSIFFLINSSKVKEKLFYPITKSYHKLIVIKSKLYN